MHDAAMPVNVALGIFAGGQASRCGGRDKGWIEVDGEAQIRRVLRAAGGGFARVLVSANRNLEAYGALGVEVVVDRCPGFQGPLAGLASLCSVLRGDFLLTVPVDALHLPVDFAARMLAGVSQGGAAQAVVAQDEDGLQPLFAAYPATLAVGAIDAFARGERSVWRWQETLPAHVCRFEGWRFGNLNSPADIPA